MKSLTERLALIEKEIARQSGRVETVKPGEVQRKVLTPKEKVVALQRKWKLSYPNKVLPEDLSLLMEIIPPGLTKPEIRGFLTGSLEEAKVTWLINFNQSRTKMQLQERNRQAGVEKALEVFESRLRKELVLALRYLPE